MTVMLVKIMGEIAVLAECIMKIGFMQEEYRRTPEPDVMAHDAERQLTQPS